MILMVLPMFMVSHDGIVKSCVHKIHACLSSACLSSACLNSAFLYFSLQLSTHTHYVYFSLAVYIFIMKYVTGFGTTRDMQSLGWVYSVEGNCSSSC